MLPHELGDYLREQREAAELSLRQLADLAGISNPYLSQIERGLKKPSAEILGQLARGLKVSAESLYVRAGLLDVPDDAAPQVTSVRQAIGRDPNLTDGQRAALLAVYHQFLGASTSRGPNPEPPTAVAGDPAPPAPSDRAASVLVPS